MALLTRCSTRILAAKNFTAARQDCYARSAVSLSAAGCMQASNEGLTVISLLRQVQTVALHTGAFGTKLLAHLAGLRARLPRKPTRR